MYQLSSTEKSEREVQHRFTGTKLTHHNLKIFNRPYLEKVFSNVQKEMHRPQDDQMLDLEVAVFNMKKILVGGDESSNSSRLGS